MPSTQRTPPSLQSGYRFVAGVSEAHLLDCNKWSTPYLQRQTASIWPRAFRNGALNIGTAFDPGAYPTLPAGTLTPLTETAVWSLPEHVTSCELYQTTQHTLNEWASETDQADAGVAPMPLSPTDARSWSSAVTLNRARPSTRLAVKDSGSVGLRARLFHGNQIEVNPDWLDFTQFDSLNMSMADLPTGPSDARPQYWRSTFTIGLGSDYQLRPDFAWHLGYRYYDNPMPATIPSGALPSASQHIVATGVTYHRGTHALTLCYGVDLYDPAASFDSSTQRATVNAGTTAQIVSLTYRYSF